MVPLVGNTDRTAFEFVNRIDRPESLRPFFRISNRGIPVDVGAWRRQVAEKLNNDPDILSQDVERYLSDVGELRRLVRERGVPVDNWHQVMTKISDSMTGRQFETGRAVAYARRALDSESITRVVVEPGSDDRIDFRIDYRDGSSDYIEAKNIRSTVENGIEFMDELRAAKGKFDGSGFSINPADGDRRIVVIGTRRRGLENDLNPRKPGEQGVRESFGNLLEAAHTEGGGFDWFDDGEWVDEVRIITPSEPDGIDFPVDEYD